MKDNLVFGRMTVLHVIREQGKQPKAVCECSCGNRKTVQLCHLRSGGIQSCGCFRKESASALGFLNSKHGQARKCRGRTYRSWESMKARCYNESAVGYNNYGGRGITVCDQWLSSFEVFLQDMGERPQGTSLDRIKNAEGYYPSNCRWSKPKIQQRNKRNNIKVMYNGEEVLLISLSEATGLSYKMLYDRIFRSFWTVEAAVTTPKRRW